MRKVRALKQLCGELTLDNLNAYLETLADEYTVGKIGSSRLCLLAQWGNRLISPKYFTVIGYDTCKVYRRDKLVGSMTLTLPPMTKPSMTCYLNDDMKQVIHEFDHLDSHHTDTKFPTKIQVKTRIIDPMLKERETQLNEQDKV